MADQELLTLGQAATVSGRSKKALRALVERGRLPAVRRDGEWLIAQADLARLAPRAQVAPSRGGVQGTTSDVATKGPPEEAADSPPGANGVAPHEELHALLDLLRRQEDRIAQLQEERARLSGQLGFVQGLLVEREARLRLLEALPVQIPAAHGMAGSNSIVEAHEQVAVPTTTEDAEPGLVAERAPARGAVLTDSNASLQPPIELSVGPEAGSLSTGEPVSVPAEGVAATGQRGAIVRVLRFLRLRG